MLNYAKPRGKTQENGKNIYIKFENAHKTGIQNKKHPEYQSKSNT